MDAMYINLELNEHYPSTTDPRTFPKISETRNFNGYA